MAVKKTNYWKLGVVAGLCLLLFLFGRSCGIKSVTKAEGSDTTLTKINFKFISIPVPYKVSNEDSIVYMTHTEHDTLEGDGVPYPVYVDTSHFPTALVEDYYSKKYYSLDTNGVKIEDTVSRNKIIGRGLTITRTDSTITKTVVLVQPKRMVGYFGLSAQGNRYNPLSGAGAGFYLKLPNEIVYGLEAKTTIYNRPTLEARVLIPIKSKRRK